MDPKELTRWLTAMNRARRAGFSDAEVDAHLKREIGIGYRELVESVKAAPRDRPSEFATTTNLLREGVLGASAGLAPLLMEPEVRGPMIESSRRFRADQPGAALAARVVGAVGVPAPGAVSIARMAGRGILPRIGVTAGLGGAYGAAEAVGEALPGAGEIPGRLATMAPAGAAGGAIFGGAAVMLTDVLPVITRSVWGRLSPEAAGRSAARRAVTDALERARMTAADVTAGVAGMERVRPGMGTVADLNETLRRLTRGAVQEGSGAIEGTVQQVRGRPMGAGERLADDVRSLTGFRTPAAVARREAGETLAARGRELFKPLENVVVPPDPRLQALLENPDVAAVWRRVRPVTGKTGKPGAADVMFLHYQNLRQRLVGARQAALRSGDTALSQLYREARNQLDDILETIPGLEGFRAANLGYAQSARTVEAFGEGAKAYRRRLPGDDVARYLKELEAKAGDEAPRAIEAYRHGMADELVRDLMSARQGPDVGGKIISLGPAQKAALKIAFGTAEAFEAFMERAALEGKFSALKNLMLGGSPTAENVSELMRSGRTAGFWGPRAAMLNMLARPNPALQASRANEVMRMMLSPADVTGSEVARLAGPRALDRIAPYIYGPGGVLAGQTGADAAEAAPSLWDMIYGQQQQPW